MYFFDYATPEGYEKHHHLPRAAAAVQGFFARSARHGHQLSIQAN
jgi:hypothetical protein